MNSSPVARRYAKALIEACDKDQNHLLVGTELNKFVGWYNESSELSETLTNPVVSIENKKAIIEALAEKGGFTPTFSNFLKVLVDAERMNEIDGIQTTFINYLDETQKQIRAEIISAFALAPDEVNAIVAELGRITGKTILADTSIDPSLIGGVVTKLGGIVVDGSLVNKLSKVSNYLNS